MTKQGKMDRSFGLLSEYSPEPTIALLHYFELLDDFLAPLNVSFETFCNEFVGSWIFGYVNALQCVGVRTVLFCITESVEKPLHAVHKPTGTPICALPPSGLYRHYRGMRRQAQKELANNSPHLQSPIKPPESPIKNLARSLGGYISTPLGLFARELRRYNCQAILCQEYEFARFDTCVLLGQWMRLPVFATFQGGNQTQSWLEVPMRHLALHKCTGVIIPTHVEIERVSVRYQIPRDKITRIFNPFDGGAWKPVERSQARAALSIPLKARVVVWHGRIQIATKGLDILLEAWQQICQERPEKDLRLIFLGTGGDAEQFRQMLDAMQLRGVLWRNEFVSDRAVLCQYLSAADVYTLPSRNEGFPVAPIEAMYCNLPVVAADAPGVADILEGGEASGGIVIPRNNVEALASALGRLLDNEVEARDLGQLARHRAESCFAPKMIGQQLRDVLFCQN
ncbi:glycosyltransferase [Scytonema sp. UIC 10036]|nr:glycosyltransferase [Scytonema sp. UIC 10036]